MVNLIVVRNIPDFLKAANVELIVNYSLKVTPYGLALIATISDYVCLLNFLKDKPPDRGLERVMSMFPDADYKYDDYKCDIDFMDSDTSKVTILAKGTPFQEKVWRFLLTIPKGSTKYYGDIAESVGSPAAVRACGTAVGRNPVALLVPCHRVIARNGDMLKFSGDPDAKRRLLEHEGVI